MDINLNLKKINNINFKKFGNVISTKNTKYTKINDGFALKYSNLSKIDVTKRKGKIQLSIFKAKARKFPMKIEMLEKHPIGTQFFFPLRNCKFIVVVAPPSKVPILKQIESFIIPPNTGINYNIGVWHYPLIAIIDSEFIVIDRKETKGNLIKFNFKKENIILKYGK